jgi:lysyl-tRNA synthetase class 2
LLSTVSDTQDRRKSIEETGRFVRVGTTANGGNDITSPFDAGPSGSEAQTLALTWENVELVLDEVRPYLRSDGGDCRIVDIYGGTVQLELQGACSSCSASSVTLKMGIERTLRDRIPEIQEVVALMPDQEMLSREGVESVLNQMRPFLEASGGTIKVDEITSDELPKVVLRMTGPPLKSVAVRVEVLNRIRKRYPNVLDVDIVGDEGR